MNVLFIMHGEISAGGIETIILSIWKMLIESGVHVDFVCHGNKKGLFEDEITSKGSEVFHIPEKASNYIRFLSEYKKILASKQYDVIHSNCNSTSGIYLKIANKFGVKKLIAHSHSTSYRAITKNPIKIIFEFLEKFKTIKYSNIKLACSNPAGKWLFGNHDFIVLKNAIDLNKFKLDNDVRRVYREKLGYSENDKVIGHVGRFSDEKNHRFIIDLFSKLKKESDKYKLLLVGDGELRSEIEEYAKQKGVFENIIFTGNVNNVQDYMQAMDLFILPSKSEGLPLVGVEAQACGLPVIFSSGVPTEAKITENVRFIPVDDLPAWKSEIRKMISLPRVNNIPKIKSEGYDIKQTADLIKNIYGSQV